MKQIHYYDIVIRILSASINCRFVENFSLLIRYKKFSASATVFVSLAFALYWAFGHFGTAVRLRLSAAKEIKPFSLLRRYEAFTSLAAEQ